MYKGLVLKAEEFLSACGKQQNSGIRNATQLRL